MQNKLVVVIVAALAMIVSVSLVATALLQPLGGGAEPNSSPRPPIPGGSDPLPVTPSTTAAIAEPAALADGLLVAYVTPTNPAALEIDEVEILTGAAAHDAAVDAGVIAANEDLPNDMWVANDDASPVLVPLADGAVVELLSAAVPGDWIPVDFADLLAVYRGSYEGPAMVTTGAGHPLLMDVTVADGAALRLRAIYQP